MKNNFFNDLENLRKRYEIFLNIFQDFSKKTSCVLA